MHSSASRLSNTHQSLRPNPQYWARIKKAEIKYQFLSSKYCIHERDILSWRSWGGKDQDSAVDLRTIFNFPSIRVYSRRIRHDKALNERLTSQGFRQGCRDVWRIWSIMTRLKKHQDKYNADFHSYLKRPSLFPLQSVDSICKRWYKRFLASDSSGHLHGLDRERN